jgi:MFS family permease
MYNLGFVIFTAFSVLLAVTWMSGTTAALWLIGCRVGQGLGGAFLLANSSAILTDAFPSDQRGLALGINNVAAIAGSFIGLVVGGLLGPINWHLVFVVSVPFGIFGTVWAFAKLRDKGIRTRSRIDWWGNLTFAAGLISVLVGVTYGILPYGGHAMGWSSPMVLGAVGGGVVLLGVFLVIETRVASPMFRLSLFRTRAFSAGNFAGLLAGLGRGGLMFMLIIWLQGIWLPEHGYSFARTPLWAGIFMLPLSAGFLIAGPVSGFLSDRFGSRPFAVGGMVMATITFSLMGFLPIDFTYIWFALLLFGNGLGMGVFASPNRAAVMNAIPPDQRGQGSGMSATTMNSATVLSMGIFFTLIIVGLAGYLPHALYDGLVAHGVPSAAAHHVADLPPTSSVFAAFLGINPIKNVLGPSGVLAALPHAQAVFLTGRSFFPSLIAGPFKHGLRAALDFAAGCCFLAAVAAAMMGKQYIYKAPVFAPVTDVVSEAPSMSAEQIDELEPVDVDAVSVTHELKL